MNESLYPKYAKLLFKIGLVATHQHLFDEAQTIMQAIMDLDFSKEQPVIGMGYNLAFQGKSRQAVDFFQQKNVALKSVSPMYEAMTGLALFSAKRFGEAERLLNATKMRSDLDSTALCFIDGLLEKIRTSNF